MKEKLTQKQTTLPKQNCKFYSYPGPHSLLKNGQKNVEKNQQRYFSKWKALERKELLLNIL